MLEHGGRLRRAAREYGIPLERWLDLSTGISPFGWPVPPVPASVWQRLPEDDDGLMEAGRAYYEAPHLLPVAGSQAAIQALPLLRPPARVGVLSLAYAEHAHAWRRAGHAVTVATADVLLENAAAWDVLVLVHPNNPGGERFDPQELLRMHAQLAERGGWLVIDEAFMDLTPQDSLCRYTEREGLLVLRSVGKFFGLAGARAGFACASPDLLKRLQEQLGPWALSAPTRHIVRQALLDRDWQAQARAWLSRTSGHLAALLAGHGWPPTAGCGLFQWCRRDDAARVHQALARHGILTRLFELPPGVRFGLPPDEMAFERLDQALAEMLP